MKAKALTISVKTLMATISAKTPTNSAKAPTLSAKAPTLSAKALAGAEALVFLRELRPKNSIGVQLRGGKHAGC